MPNATTATLDPVLSGPVFSEPGALPDPDGPGTVHADDKETYARIHDLLARNTVSFQPKRGKPGDLFTLADALGPGGAARVKEIGKGKRIVFHALGDSGASDAGGYQDELKVFDQLAYDCHTAVPEDRPAFMFHLGDVVYSFGEAKYYYDQFYEPNRNYPAPIFAIPGNHDSFVVPGTPPAAEPLVTFGRNFCAERPTITPEAASLHRTAMTQPGVYFALDAPFVRIIGLFSNALEDPGLISGEGGKWPGVPDDQIGFLEAQLDGVRKYPYAVLLAVHHPPFSFAPPSTRVGAGGNHRSSWQMLQEIDRVCKKVGVYPHAVISGHAHNYQRYTRRIRFGKADYEVPFVVCGNGGHHVNSLVRASRGVHPTPPEFGTDVTYLECKPEVSAKGLVLEKYDDRNYGYLRISADAAQLRIAYHRLQ
ncbi:MAG: metallophosphoesterase, partial [Gemmatimonadetes bacterium]|nr:metallophosphoesterase [Gemmatimonadota bacterium]